QVLAAAQLKERGLPHLLLFLPALLPAMLFHSIHNSSELVGALLGEGAMAAHCCLVVPLFDYGGLTLVALAMLVWHAWLSRKKGI
ncbi:MAG: hypothetical protein N3H30_02905, partial [Candidatus Micrarchaeota archaeon]|nr:hypothetical protein [Candidatus Micrarchaeota archaeon]